MSATHIAGIIAVLWSLQATEAYSAAGDAEAGRRKTVTCNGCHAQANLQSVPKLGGQSATYFILAMRAYQDGKRGHATMRDVAKAYSDKELKNFAAYYAQFARPEVSDSPAIEKPAAAASCQVCHGAEGRLPIDQASAILAGQKSSYLKAALLEYRDGTRPHAVMQAAVADLTDVEIDALSDYYARLDGLEVK